MEAALGAHIFHRQLPAVFIAEYGLVLGTVVGEQTLNIADPGTEFHIYKKDDHFQHALGEVAYHIA